MYGNVEMMNGLYIDPTVELKKVYFRPSTDTDVVKVGQVVCLNTDLAADYQERTTQPAEDGTVFAEGAQTYNARILVAEKPASGNLHTPHIILELGSLAGADGDLLTVAPLIGGAVLPVWTSANCTLDETPLGVASGSYVVQAVTGDGDPLMLGVAAETVNRSVTNGLVWMRMTGQAGVGHQNASFNPIRWGASGYAYGINVNGDKVLRGTADSKSYVVQIAGDRDAAYAATGDSNDALLKLSGNNYAADDTNFIFRGLNAAINNRSGGVLGRIEHSLGSQGKSGGTVTNILGLTITAENYGTMGASGTFGGLDIVLKNEAAVAATEFGIRIRNENNSIAGPVESVFSISETGVNTGFTYLLKIAAAADVGVIAASGDIAFTSADKLIPVRIAGVTYYLVATDNV